MQYLHEYRQRFVFNRTISHRAQKILLQAATNKADALLGLRLPVQIIDRLKTDSTHVADHYDCVTILQSDVKGFTNFSAKVTPFQLRKFVNAMFERFSGIVDRHGLYTIGSSLHNH